MFIVFVSLPVSPSLKHYKLTHRLLFLNFIISEYCDKNSHSPIDSVDTAICTTMQL